jgi:hypothetical protein
MTSLQQTAMLGGAASAKTASYTLVAADAGTAISMDSASATTITVNTSLFAAGDTVQITNLGAGVCTITAGTATVNTSASLALAQYESGTLDFTSTSAAIFSKGAGAAATSGGMTLLSTTSLTGSSVTISSISQDYIHLELILVNPLQATDATSYKLRVNNDTATRYATTAAESLNYAPDDTAWVLAQLQDNTVSQCTIQTIIMNYTATTRKTAKTVGVGANSSTSANFNLFDANHAYNQTTAITSLVLFPGSGNWTSGSALLYGVK